MREIAWLQVSDIHMQRRDEWPQDVILRAMVDSIRLQRTQGLVLDFILATGDLAFSGKTEEYVLVGRFLDELANATGVPKERIFCIPGNHDVNRDRQKLCFHGARSKLTSSNAVDTVLAPVNDDLVTLTQRQEAYNAFQASYFGTQNRTATPDSLAYVASLTIDDVDIVIVGLNSAWLAEGGNGDHGHLLIGERQVINAFDAVSKLDPHIVIGMAHHPLHLLHEFDRNAVTRYITKHCAFYHCGHLHQPEAYGAGFDASACLTVTAGASFETRESQNAYSLVKLDLLEGIRILTTVQYDPWHGEFALNTTTQFPIRLATAAMCTVGELADAITEFEDTLALHSYYLAALLLEQKTEVPIPGQDGYAFGALAVLRGLPEDEYYRKVVTFLRFGNVLTVFNGRRSLADLFAQHGQAVRAFGTELLSRCQSDAALASRLAQQDEDVRKLFAVQPKISFAVDLFDELVTAQDWALLREQAVRHLDNSDEATKEQARRMLALALANSGDVGDRKEAVSSYEALIRDGLDDPQIRANLAILLFNLDRHDEAKIVVIQAIEASPFEALEYLRSIGQRIVAGTGDRAFRKQLEVAIAQRGSHD